MVTVFLAVRQTIRGLPASGLRHHKGRRIVVPHLDPQATIGQAVKSFISECLQVPACQQQLSAPLFLELDEEQTVGALCGLYQCGADEAQSDLHLDEDTFRVFASERGRRIALNDDDLICDRHIMDRSTLELSIRPQPLDGGRGGRIFVDTKYGMLPLLDVKPDSTVADIKEMIFKHIGLPLEQQVLLSAGVELQDGTILCAPAGASSVHSGSVLDLCCPSDGTKDRAHCRKLVHVTLDEEHRLDVVVQGLDQVSDLIRAAEDEAGLPAAPRTVEFSGRQLEPHSTISECGVPHGALVAISSITSSGSKGTDSSDTNTASKGASVSSPRKGAKGHSRSVSADETNGAAGGQPGPFVKGGHRRTGSLPGCQNSEPLEGSPSASKLKLMRTSQGRIVGSVVMPLSPASTVKDLKRKLQRHLQPLLEKRANLQDRSGALLSQFNSAGNLSTASPLGCTAMALPSPPAMALAAPLQKRTIQHKGEAPPDYLRPRAVDSNQKRFPCPSKDGNAAHLQNGAAVEKAAGGERKRRFNPFARLRGRGQSALKTISEGSETTQSSQGADAGKSHVSGPVVLGLDKATRNEPEHFFPKRSSEKVTTWLRTSVGSIYG